MVEEEKKYEQIFDEFETVMSTLKSIMNERKNPKYPNLTGKEIIGFMDESRRILSQYNELINLAQKIYIVDSMKENIQEMKNKFQEKL